MRTLLRPRLSTLDVFASALLVSLGVKLTSGCGGDVTVSSADTGSGGAGATGAGAGGESATTASSGVGVGTTTATSTSGAGGGAGGCVDPRPVISQGVDTGIDVCAGGQYRRREAIACPARFPDTDPCCGTCPDGQICNHNVGKGGCGCTPACLSDAECGADQLCMCGPNAGRCISAACKTGDDCAAGQSCTTWDTTRGCFFYEFACTTAADTCGGDLDCSGAPGSTCAVQTGGTRACVPGGCAIGRPFLVGGTARTAPLAARADWAEADLSPEVEGLDAGVRAELAAAWEHTARMEHASIAAFARFTLDLLALGAPAELVERTGRAMADETRHARAAFALASAYRGRPCGPGALSVGGALDGARDVATIVRLLIREGCVGETVAAVEAGEAETRAEDPGVAAVLGQIARDESEHAELAWRTLRWALAERGDAVRAEVRAEIAALRAERGAAVTSGPSARARDEAMLRCGVVTRELGAAMRQAVVQRAVLPCLEKLVEESEKRAGEGEAQAA